jgi:hypothetical protein
MDLVDITTWATTETKHVEISQIFLDAPYTVEVREFVPVAGDKLFETWTSDGVVKSHSLPRYALADMRKTATLLERFIDCNIGTYIKGAVGTLDHLLWFTYMFAFIHVKEAKVICHSPDQDLPLTLKGEG